MKELEALIRPGARRGGALAAVARRVGAPYPVFLAVGGATPRVRARRAIADGSAPELALALFVAPVLLDAAYDAWPRDLRDNWVPVTGARRRSRSASRRSPLPW